MQRGAFDRRKQLVGRGVVQVPAKGDAAERGVDQDGAVAVVPGEAEQAGLPGLELGSGFGERGDRGSGAGCNGSEDIADRGHARFDADAVRIDRARDDAADAGDERLLVAETDDAGRGADDVDHVAKADVGADGVPVRVERANGNGNACSQAEGLRPLCREVAGDLVRRVVAAGDLRAHAGEQRVNRY